MRPAQVTPCAFDSGSITGLHSYPGQWDVQHFEKATVVSYRNRVKAILVADENAQTSKLVRVGDDLALARERYPRLACDVERFEDTTGDPVCPDTQANGYQIIFGGDPIQSIVIGTRAIG